MYILLQFFSLSAQASPKQSLFIRYTQCHRASQAFLKHQSCKIFIWLLKGAQKPLLTLSLAFPHLHKARSMGCCDRCLISFQLLIASFKPASVYQRPLILSLGQEHMNSLKVGLESATPWTYTMLKLLLSKVVLLFLWDPLTLPPRRTSKICQLSSGSLAPKKTLLSKLSEKVWQV